MKNLFDQKRLHGTIDNYEVKTKFPRLSVVKTNLISNRKQNFLYKKKYKFSFLFITGITNCNKNIRKALYIVMLMNNCVVSSM